MKYKVSLLPEVNRKRLNGRKKSEKIQVYALVSMLILFAVLLLVIGSKFFAQNKLKKIRSLDERCKREVSELEQYREINAALEAKINLIESITVQEPELSNFIATICNIEHTGVSIMAIDCSDWKVERICIIEGTCSTRNDYLRFEETLAGIEGVTGVTNTGYTNGVGTTDGLVHFTVSISCGGGVVIDLAPIGPDGPIIETTEIDANVGIS